MLTVDILQNVSRKCKLYLSLPFMKQFIADAETKHMVSNFYAIVISGPTRFGRTRTELKKNKPEPGSSAKLI